MRPDRRTRAAAERRRRSTARARRRGAGAANGVGAGAGAGSVGTARSGSIRRWHAVAEWSRPIARMALERLGSLRAPVCVVRCRGSAFVTSPPLGVARRGQRLARVALAALARVRGVLRLWCVRRDDPARRRCDGGDGVRIAAERAASDEHGGTKRATPRTTAGAEARGGAPPVQTEDAGESCCCQAAR